MQTFAIDDGLELVGQRWAGDGPTLVMLHSGVTDHRSWELVAPFLQEQGFDLVAYDRRGFSPDTSTTAGFTHVGDLLRLLDELRVRHPVWLVGNSVGAAVALDAALQHPDRVEGLVLLAPAISGAPRIDDDELDEATRRLDHQIETTSGQQRLRAQTHLWLDGPSQEEGRVGGRARELTLAMGRRLLDLGFDEDAGAGEVDAWSKLEQVRQPVGVGWGEFDVPIIIERCRHLVRRLPVSTSRSFDGAGHLLPLDVPRELADWIGGLTGRPNAVSRRLDIDS